MWHCNWGLPFTHGGWFLGHGLVGLLLSLLLAAAVIFILVRVWHSIFVQRSESRDSADSLEILRARFARGEISAEEYQRMREILRR